MSTSARMREVYKEIQNNIEGYYKLSLEKEQKQKSYLKRLKVFCKKRMNLDSNNGNTWSGKTVLFGH